MPRYEVLAEVVRSGFVEGHHHGALVALDADGDVVLCRGDPDEPVFPRSSNKPLQAVGMLRAGLDLDGPLLALATSSHSGEDLHLDGVRRILAGAGLDTSALRTPPALPYDEVAAARWVAGGRGPEPVAMNCSGKHAAMLATCVTNGWDLEGYRDVEHPLQVALSAAVEDLSGEVASATGVDGCGAPVLALSLTALARAFTRIATAAPGSAEHRLAQAVRQHPVHVGGSRRDVTRFLEAVPGLVAKDGAEGVYAAALPDGRAVALKVADGGDRARGPLLVAALRRLGVDTPGLEAIGASPVLGGGVTVGEVRALL